MPVMKARLREMTQNMSTWWPMIWMESTPRKTLNTTSAAYRVADNLVRTRLAMVRKLRMVREPAE